MYRNQIDLKEMDPEQNKSFLKLIYQCDDFIDDGFPDVVKEFTRLKDSMHSDRFEPDLKIFLDNINWNYHTQLGIGMRPPERIMYCAGYSDPEEGRVMFLFECPLNQNNYDLVSDFFRESYSKDLESVEISEETQSVIDCL